MLRTGVREGRVSFVEVMGTERGLEKGKEKTSSRIILGILPLPIAMHC